MPGLESVSSGLVLFLICLTTAFLGVSNSDLPEKSRTQESVNYVSVAGNLFLSHRQSLGALLSSNGVKDSKRIESEALASLSFDDDVENLLENGW